jgi:hypothetical protein
MRTLLKFLFAIFFVSCGKNEGPLDSECFGVIDTEAPGVFYIELVDAEGNNLIENGYYDKGRITTILNGDDFDYQTLSSDENSNLENLLVVAPI